MSYLPSASVYATGKQYGIRARNSSVRESIEIVTENEKVNHGYSHGEVIAVIRRVE